MMAIGFGAMLALTVGWRTVARAGEKHTQAVTVSTRFHTFNGSLGAARNSADGVSYIMCVTEIRSGYTNAGIYCEAKDATGAAEYCYGPDDPRYAQVLSALSDDSMIYVNGDDNHNCTYIQARSDSRDAPRGP